MIRTAAVVGTGLIGTSTGLALSRRGVHVHLLDVDESAARVAAARGAGTFGPPADPVDLAVIAVPPARVAQVLAEQQRRGLALAYTDVASVKSATALAVSQGAVHRSSYVGGHPMAGSERSGPLAARADLFEGRSWVLTPGTETSTAALNGVLAAVALCGAVPVVMEPSAHDRAVALVSHAPHLVAALMAARLGGASRQALDLAGQGVRDVIRIAGGDPALWTDIIRRNASAIGETLGELLKDLEALTGALHALEVSGSDAEDALASVRELLLHGQDGWEAVYEPGGAPAGQVTLTVPVADRPGEVDRLIHTAEGSGIGADGIRLCWSRGSARLSAPRLAAESVRRRLADDGWRVSVTAAPS
ncbi:prephenate dehydrogenase [Streptomyces aurantiacus]|uniref:prephenate dehydrogenase n=1 Tax=Streptomyces aurantiacus TaxID=47760 RepID=UPI002792F0A4|nr:prephenate dehydrogenase [Streptomyces aurantiacus]MDQ0773208.1 prephenate dehydrogenase [Streptomyces aurantiacus]